MKELESFRGHRKDVTALAWHPFHEEYFVSGSYDGSTFHWLVGHDTPQLEVSNAHDNSVWDLAWHPVGYLLCSGSNDHTTKFWCRNRPGDIPQDKYNMVAQGYGEQNHPLAGRVFGNFPMPETPTTPGPFPPGLTRNEGTIPGVGVAMPLSIPSLDASQGDQPGPGSGPLNAPPFPTGPHPSLIPPNQHQPFQMNPQQISQQHQPHQSLPQQMGHMQMPPNMPHLQQHPSHALFPHPHLPRPQHQMPPIGSVPSSLSMPAPPSASTSLPMQMQGPFGMQGGMNQMRPPLQQGHYMGMNPMHSGTLASSGGPPSMGGFTNGMPNMQGPSNASGPQMYPQAGSFNHPQAGQMAIMPGYNPYQSGGQSGMPQQPGPRSQTPQ